MTFLILCPLDNGTYASITPADAELSAQLAVAADAHPGAFLVETVTEGANSKAAIPGELARAIEAWNAMPPEVTVPRLRGNPSRFVAPYRRWKKEAGARDYLLEQLVADVVASPFCWPWIRFSWLFGKKNGELNSEKLRSEAARGGWKNGAANGEMTEADFVRLAARVDRWYERVAPMFVGEDDPAPKEQRFLADIGISRAQWRKIQERFVATPDPEGDGVARFGGSE